MPAYPYYAPDFAVKINGLTLAADVRQAVRSLTYDNNVDTADMFTLQLNNADLRFTDSALLDVGKDVEIYMGYADELLPMMLGEITAISPSFPESGAPTLTVTGYDKSHRMRSNSPPQRTFDYANDSLIAAQIAAENLLIPVVDPTPLPREKHTQTGSDWALLKELADRNFFQVFVRWDKLYFRFPRPQTEKVVLEWGRNLSSFAPRLSTAGQIGIEVIRGYDEQLAQTIVMILPAVAVGADLNDIIERLGSGIFEQLVKLGRHVIRDRPVRNFADAAALAKAVLQQLLDGLFEGSGNCIGLPALRAGDIIEIRGVGKRFSGQYTLSRVTHTMDESGYRTSFEVTQKYSTTLLQSLRQKIAETPSPNRQEPIEGVLIGRVRQNVDPGQLGRVKVTIPHHSDTNLTQWARVASFMAGGGLDDSWGGYFLPDIDDEVLVAFIQGDINQPVILGSLWNRLAPPPEQNIGPNAKKLLKTKTGMQILFDETPQQETLTIQDKAGNTLTLDSKFNAEQIQLKDKAGNTITLNAKTGAEGILIAQQGGQSTIALKENQIEIKAGDSIVITLNQDNNIVVTATNKTIEMSCDKLSVTGNVEIQGTLDVTGDTTVKTQVAVGSGPKTTITGGTIQGG